MTPTAIDGPRILLRSGAYFDLQQPEATPLPIEDVAHALAHLCRFTGHGAAFYSVAEHSLHAAAIVPPAFALEALLHDAAEAVLGDVSSPLKQLLPDYKALERRVDAALRRSFGLPAEMSPEVKRADLRMLAAEQRQVMANRDDWPVIRNVPPAPAQVQFWAPETARRAFLLRYRHLAQRAA